MTTSPVWQATKGGRVLALALLACGPSLGCMPDSEGGSPRETSDDAAQGEDFDGDGEIDPRSTVIEASPSVRRALCTDEYATAELSYDTITRGSWQFNPGGGFVNLPEPGYPCRAFLYDSTRPSPFDARWTNAVDRDFVGFSESSAIIGTTYLAAQFRYFRTALFIPTGKRPSTLALRASGIDDALFVAIYNSTYPDGFSPNDAGPKEAEVGACSGNGQASWDFADYVEPGEVNVLLLVHADMSAATSSLTSVEIDADGQPIQMVSCE